MRNIVLLLFLPFITLGQDYIFEYEYSFIKDTLDSQLIKERYFLFQQGADFVFVGDYYFFLDSLGNDKRVVSPSAGATQIKRNSNRDRSTLKAVVQKSNNEVVFYKNFFNKIKVMYKHKLLLNWQLSEDTLTYINYAANKAFTAYAGRKYIAVYTMDIPMPTGPYVFNKLPGLILSVEDDKQQHSFKLIGIRQGEKEIEFNHYTELSPIEFFELEKSVKNNPLQMLLPNAEMSEEKKRALKERIKEKNKRDNNPIELINK